MSTNPDTRAILTRFAFHRRNRLLRLAIFLIALWQVGTTLVPHTGTFSGATSSRSHLHAPGDPLDLAHDETACPACSGHQVAIWVSTPARPHGVFIHKFHPIFTAEGQPVFTDHFVVIRARGPPALV